jgi:hypothetical protein
VAHLLATYTTILSRTAVTGQRELLKCAQVSAFVFNAEHKMNSDTGTIK